MKIKKLQSFSEILTEFFDLKGKTVPDMGCSTGELKRRMVLQRAYFKKK